MTKKKIIKPTIFHSIAFKTLSTKTALRYSISLFLTGIIFLFVSFHLNNNSSEHVLQIFSCFALILGIYILPFFEFDKIEKFLLRFVGYIILLIITLFVSAFWYSFCKIAVMDNLYLFLISLFSLVEFVLIVLCVNNTLNPIIEIIGKVTSTIKTNAESKSESKYLTYLKTFCANGSLIISFLISFFTLITTIQNFINI